jgi:predicted alpha/beta hydrolase
MNAVLPLLCALLGVGTTLADTDKPAAYQLVDAGHELDAPVALVVVTPGLDPSAFQPMVQALEEAGLDAWAVRVRLQAPLPPADADIWIATTLLPSAAAELRERNPRAQHLALVGHGPGGTLALMSAQHIGPDAVAVLGSPVGPVESAALEWLAQRPLPELGNVDLTEPASWQGHDLARLLLGEPLPPLLPLPVELARAWVGWIERGPPLRLEAVPCPVFVGAAAMDRLVPVESLRVASQALEQRHFVRFGLLRIDPQDPGHGELLSERRYLDVTASWVREQLD